MFQNNRLRLSIATMQMVIFGYNEINCISKEDAVGTALTHTLQKFWVIETLIFFGVFVAGISL